MVRKIKQVGGVLTAVLVGSLLAACTSVVEKDDASFTLAMPSLPASMDMAQAYNTTHMTALSVVTQPLEQIAIDGALTPLLAESASQPDDLTIVYDLREDVLFSDGSALSAEDVVWSLEHLRGPDAQTSGEFANVTSIEATGALQVTIKLAKPDPAQRGAIALVGFIQQAKFGAANEEALGSSTALPIGTGPFAVTAFTPERIEMTQNAHYFGEEPAVGMLEFVAIAEDPQMQLAMRSDAIDGAIVTDLTAVSEWKNIDGATTYSTPGIYSYYISMDTTKPPFDDQNVRQAVAHAVDSAGITNAAFGDEAVASKTMTIGAILSSIAPSDAEAKAFVDGLPRHEFDLDKAKAALAKSAHPDGFDVTMTYKAEGTFDKLAALNLQENLSQIGITVTVEPMPTNDLLSKVYEDDPPLFHPMRVAPAVPHPSSWYPYLMTDGGVFNTANWSTPSTVEALAMLNSPNPAEVWEGTKLLMSEMAEQLPYAPSSEPNDVTVLSEGFIYRDDSPSLFDYTSGAWIDRLTVGG